MLELDPAGLAEENRQGRPGGRGQEAGNITLRKQLAHPACYTWAALSRGGLESGIDF